MTMSRCRECGEAVSSEAVTCPRCGIANPAAVDRGADAGVRTAASAGPAAVPVVRAQRVRRGWRTIALLLLLVLVALWGLWYSDIVNFR
jgi:hypothetical protein